MVELVDSVDLGSSVFDVQVRVLLPAPYEVVPSFELFYRKAELLFAKNALFLTLFRTALLCVILKNTKILKINIYYITEYGHLFSIKALFLIFHRLPQSGWVSYMLMWHVVASHCRSGCIHLQIF